MDGQRRQEIYDAWERNTIARGHRKGREEGREEGWEEEQRRSLLLAYEVRFEEIPQDLKHIIETTHDIHKLRSWLRLFMTATPEQIRKELRG